MRADPFDYVNMKPRRMVVSEPTGVTRARRAREFRRMSRATRNMLCRVLVISVVGFTVCLLARSFVNGQPFTAPRVALALLFGVGVTCAFVGILALSGFVVPIESLSVTRRGLNPGEIRPRRILGMALRALGPTGHALVIRYAPRWSEGPTRRRIVYLKPGTDLERLERLVEWLVEEGRLVRGA